jgi:hypothetical protein
MVWSFTFCPACSCVISCQASHSLKRGGNRQIRWITDPQPPTTRLLSLWDQKSQYTVPGWQSWGLGQNYMSELGLIEMARCYKNAPLFLQAKLHVTYASEIQDTIRNTSVGKAPMPNRIANRILKHLHKLAIALLTNDFRVISIPKLGKYHKLSSSCRSVSLLYTTDELFRTTPLGRNISEGRRHSRTRTWVFDSQTARSCSWPFLSKQTIENLTWG